MMVDIYPFFTLNILYFINFFERKFYILLFLKIVLHLLLKKTLLYLFIFSIFFQKLIFY